MFAETQVSAFALIAVSVKNLKFREPFCSREYLTYMDGKTMAICQRNRPEFHARRKKVK